MTVSGMASVPFPFFSFSGASCFSPFGVLIMVFSNISPEGCRGGFGAAGGAFPGGFSVAEGGAGTVPGEKIMVFSKSTFWGGI